MDKIISAFPGTGKSYFANNYRGKGIVLDSDSSSYSWVPGLEGQTRNPDFPENYIRFIIRNLDMASFILVSSHAEVRDGLVASRLDFSLVYPAIGLKEEYLERFRTRGSSEGFISLLSSKWDKFIGQLEAQEGANHIILQKGQYLSDVLDDGKDLTAEE